MTPDPGKLRRFAEDYTAAWCNMDPVRVAAHYAPDGSLAINGGTPAVGREAIADRDEHRAGRHGQLGARRRRYTCMSGSAA
jgi:hypothetical protein